MTQATNIHTNGTSEGTQYIMHYTSHKLDIEGAPVLSGSLTLSVMPGSDLALIATAQLIRVQAEHMYPDLSMLYSTMRQHGSHFDIRLAWKYLHACQIPLPSDRLISDWFAMYDILVEHSRKNSVRGDSALVFNYDLERAPPPTD